jgi:cobaltochelatase CobN
MHLLQAQAGGIADGNEAVDLGQSAGEIVVLSAADTELASLSAARAQLGESFPSLRLANLMQLSHNLSVDLYIEQVIANAKLVIVRLLGGESYWPYGVEQIAAACRARGVALALLPGDDQPDAQLSARSTLDAEAIHRLWQYGVHGGPENARNLLAYGAHLIGRDMDWQEPRPILRAGLYWPAIAEPRLQDIRAQWQADAPIAALVFYRALVQAGNLAAVDSLIDALRGEGINPLPLYVSSLKEPLSAETLARVFADAKPELVLNATGFAVSTPGAERRDGPFDALDCPVMQVVFAGGTHEAWRSGTQGLSARDLAMNVALPEVDGRVLSRAVSFKAEQRFDDATQCALATYAPVPDRIDFVAQLAANWLRLARTLAEERKVALVLANYPNRDGRIGNGVGLDTPAGTLNVLRALKDAGYDTGELPKDGDTIVTRLLEGPTNATIRARRIEETLPRPDYEFFFGALPQSLQDAVIARWGPPETDPFYMPGELDCGAFAIPAFRLGKIVVGLQPARGYNIDPQASYHDPALVPPHGYLAFYAWLREAFRAQAVVHMGKHGNLEWLPGKAVALSQDCYPEAALGPMPHLYPFIVNDPGEGTQAKRRAQAVIVDHLTPPLTRAETYGPLAELERLVDEYYEAAGYDPRRLKVLRGEILELTARIGLDKDCGIAPGEDADSALGKLDNYLCELKEMQIRDGLHIFGASPQGNQETDLLVALTRLPRGAGKDGEASLIRALAKDLGMTRRDSDAGVTPTPSLPHRGGGGKGGAAAFPSPLEGEGQGGGCAAPELDKDAARFDPLDCVLGEVWDGPRPAALAQVSDAAWRTKGDTLERLELVAQALVGHRLNAPQDWTATRAVIKTIETQVRPAVAACGEAELAGLLTGLDGRFVVPGPSGAPTRGKLDVLPTGRNFYSVDTRVVPTPAAWNLGWTSAARLLARHRQEHGAWPKTIALSAWGTANMRTGGDDIAQALALIGARPTWETASRRVTGFEIIPSSVLDRPRVDVTLRVSGFFRDAFPAQIDLFDSAVRAVAALEEPESINPLAARVRADTQDFVAQGHDEKDAAQRAGFRVFGSKPGAYGAGLQALIDERGWNDAADLARAYLAWGGYAYGAGAGGAAARDLFEARLSGVEAVLHNQDNREHDLLDSDDYYQFEGGLSAAVKHLSGTAPQVYHNDHSRPESPKIRTLEAEVARVVRARVVNPKWIAGVMRHGYKGAFEMAATLDYMFAFAATTGAVKDHHFDAVYEAFLEDDDVRGFLEEANPAALKDMAARLIEAQDRGLWRPRANTTHRHLKELL